MIVLRKAAERGHADQGWLNTYHSFSFADYYDPRHMGFGALRVLNDDRVQPGKGFGMHPHRDMEIITYILEGELQHRDSMGNGSVIRPGDVQRMSAGIGILHSEFNPSASEPVHLLQIWIEPNVRGITPSYEQKHYPEEDRRGHLRLIASPDGARQSVTIHQDARVYGTVIEPGDSVVHHLAPGRRAYVHVARGSLAVDGERLQGGDAAKITDEQSVTLRADETAEVLLFDLA